MMAIDLYCNDGSPLGIIPADIYDRGVGGAELALMSWAEAMSARGHHVRIYNDPRHPVRGKSPEYMNRSDFRPADPRDVFVAFRSPNPFIIRAVAKRCKVHWSTDQHTIGNFATDIFPYVDLIVCISPFHVNYHKVTYKAPADRIGYIDLGVRLGDYDLDGVEKIPGRCIYCSVPDRGLDPLRAAWQHIKTARPDASLVITSDYRLWGARQPMNHKWRLAWLNEPNVTFLGKIPRADLVREQLQAQVHSYPCYYEELFCISVAECTVAGAVPITSDIGSLATTNAWGTVIPGSPINVAWRRDFIAEVLQAMEMPDKDRQKMVAGAKARFDWARIAERWERLLTSGRWADA